MKKIILKVSICFLLGCGLVISQGIVCQQNSSIYASSVDDIINSVKQALDNPFGKEGKERIKFAENQILNLPEGKLKEALTQNLGNAKLCSETEEKVVEMWVILSQAGWQTKYGDAMSDTKIKLNELKKIFPNMIFVKNFEGSIEDQDNIYQVFNLMDIATINPSDENIVKAQKETELIKNTAVKTNLEKRMESEILPKADFKVISIE